MSMLRKERNNGLAIKADVESLARLLSEMASLQSSMSQKIAQSSSEGTFKQHQI
jgi:hypothetical protein